jgi:hypothetical protein
VAPLAVGVVVRRHLSRNCGSKLRATASLMHAAACREQKQDAMTGVQQMKTFTIRTLRCIKQACAADVSSATCSPAAASAATDYTYDITHNVRCTNTS